MTFGIRTPSDTTIKQSQFQILGFMIGINKLIVFNSYMLRVVNLDSTLYHIWLFLEISEQELMKQANKKILDKLAGKRTWPRGYRSLLPHV